MRIPSESIRDRWLEAALPLVETDGWTKSSLHRAAEIAGIDAGEQALAAPNGVNDLIDHMFEQSADTMLETLVTRDLQSLRVHERVAAGVRAWLDGLEPRKTAVRKAAGRGMLPWGAGAASRRVWRIADAIWEAAGDTATDYNRQTKRALLSAVLPGITLRWLAGLEGEALDQLIMKRLKQAMKLGQTGGKVVKPLLDTLSSLRAK